LIISSVKVFGTVEVPMRTCGLTSFHDCEEVIVLFALPLIVLAGVWPLGGCEFIALRLEE